MCYIHLQHIHMNGFEKSKMVVVTQICCIWRQKLCSCSFLEAVFENRPWVRSVKSFQDSFSTTPNSSSPIIKICIKKNLGSLKQRRKILLLHRSIGFLKKRARFHLSFNSNSGVKPKIGDGLFIDRWP